VFAVVTFIVLIVGAFGTGAAVPADVGAVVVDGRFCSNNPGASEVPIVVDGGTRVGGTFGNASGDSSPLLSAAAAIVSGACSWFGVAAPPSDMTSIDFFQCCKMKSNFQKKKR
jgi:hypothetical protein